MQDMFVVVFSEWEPYDTSTIFLLVLTHLQKCGGRTEEDLSASVPVRSLLKCLLGEHLGWCFVVLGCAFVNTNHSEQVQGNGAADK